MEGDHHTVVIERKTIERIDLRAMREQLPEKIWRPYLTTTEAVYVTIRRKRETSTYRRDKVAIAAKASKVAMADRSREEP